jgi:iron complex outermembrane receptor protein
MSWFSSGAWAQATSSGTPAAAQQQPDENGLIEVLVTARRRVEAVSDVPLSLSVYSSDDLLERNIVTTADLVKITPGLNITGAGSAVNPFIVMRGASRATAGPGVPGVITYLNEVPLPTYGSLISTLDMDNIQVLKGPQGTLFGRNTVGGAVLTYTKRPTFELEGSALAEYSSFDTINAELILNAPVVADRLAVRVAGQYQSTDGFTDTVHVSDYTQTSAVGRLPGTTIDGGRNLDEFVRKGARVSVLFEPFTALSNVIVLDYYREDGGGNTVANEFWPTGFERLDGTIAPPALPFIPASALAGSPSTAAITGMVGSLFQCTTSPLCNLAQYGAQARARGVRHAATNLPVGDSYAEIFGVSNTTTWKARENLTLKNIVAYRWNDVFTINDIDGTPMPIIDSAGRVQLQQVTEELQATGSAFADKLSYTLGGFYYEQSPHGVGGFQAIRANVFAGINHTESINYETNESQALYGQLDYDLSSLLAGLQITAGYRHTWDSARGCAAGVTLSIAQFYPNGNHAPLETEAQCRGSSSLNVGGVLYTNSIIPENKTDQGTYTFALTYKPRRGVMLYATTRRGYRAGDYNSPFYTGPLTFLAPVQYFDSEVADDVELGGKFEFAVFGRPAGLNLSYFRVDDQGFQFYETTTNVVTRVANPALGIVAGVALPTAGITYNKADLTIQGGELELTFSPLRGLTLGANAAYTDVEVDSLTIPAVVLAAFANAPGSSVNSDPTKGFGIPFVSDWQANANLAYTFAGELLGGTLSLHADYHYQSSYIVNQVRMDGYDVANARVSLTDFLRRPVDLSFYIKNFTDETYAYGSATSTPSGVGVTSRIWAPPRTFGASIRVRFGG